MKVLALYSSKGGVGKTAAAVNLSYLAAQSGLQTLICDLDSQASASFYFRVKPKLRRKARGLSKAGKAIEKSIKGTDFDNLDLLPADISHRKLDISFDHLKNSTERLDEILESLQNEYELIVLDCPPNLNLVAENVFNSAHIILEPLIPTTLSVQTHQRILTFYEKEGYDTQKYYAFFSLVDNRKKLHRQLMEMLRTESPAGLLRSVIPSMSDVEKMGLEREPVDLFAPNSKAAMSYQALWDEVNPFLIAT